MKATILITSFNRAHLLKFGLESLSAQNFPRENIEIVVLNDGAEDETEQVTKSFADKLNIKYYHTGKNFTKWRIPGFAINFGVKNTDSEFIFISCAEMYHLDNTVEVMLSQLTKNNKLLTICNMKDDNGYILNKLNDNKHITEEDYNIIGPLHNFKLPFFMGMNRKDFVDIGGYDEDFIGIGYDDNDIVDRMLAVGNKYHNTHVKVIHLYHDRIDFSKSDSINLCEYNKQLYLKKKNIIIRNQDKDWGLNKHG